ncbi:MAG: YkgJ family cysteine cluster protein [Nitrososphaerota archaeon]
MTNDDKYSIKTLCSNCMHQSCCTGFDSAVVFPEDLVNFQNNDKATDEFLEDVVIAGKTLKQIRKKQSHECIFWSGKCEIYAFRPLDCRLFPFDIDMIDGEFYWILYACNTDTNWKWTEDYLQKLEADPMLHKRRDYFEIFAKGPYSEPERMPYTVLRKVRFD